MEGKKFVQYEHHGRNVWVEESLKGTHREYCLCWGCVKFDPDDRDLNCSIANLLFAVDVQCGLVTPVFECPEFVPYDQEQ